MAGSGRVQRLRERFERLIRAQPREAPSVLLDRILRRNEELIVLGRRYREQLQLTEHFTLSDLPENLRSFVRDHHNLHTATVRSRQEAWEAIQSPDMDVFSQLAYRIVHVRLVYHLGVIRETRNPMSRTPLTENFSIETELRDCTTLLTDEIFRILSRLDTILSSIPLSTFCNPELENIGPDHDIADFGHELALRPVRLIDHRQIHHQHHLVQPKNDTEFNDPIHRCCICLDYYQPSTHPPFQLTVCGHIIGTPCLATWLNSTAENATSCPFCRAPLCERRARRPKPVPVVPIIATTAEQDELMTRLRKTLDFLGDVDHVVCETLTEEQGEEGDWTDRAVEELNMRLFEEGVAFGFARDGFEGLGWRVLRLDWDAL